jgi:hypothetical protein
VAPDVHQAPEVPDPELDVRAARVKPPRPDECLTGTIGHCQLLDWVMVGDTSMTLGKDGT